MKQFRLILAFIVLLAAGPVTSFAWSGTEHKLMAYIAQEHLLPSTQTFLDKYLDQSIVGYANWMDRYRKSPGYEQTDRWHMVTIREDGAGFVAEDEAEGKAYHALSRAIGILRNYREYDDSTVFINIVYVIHLVPEVHCPSHYYFYDLGGAQASRDRNFASVRVGGSVKTYHSLWDSSITSLYPGLNLDRYAEIFDTLSAEEQTEVCRGGIEDWMLDNSRVIRKIYDWAYPGDSLPSDFLQRHREVPEEMARKAGVRLAFVLNELFGGEGR